MLTATNEIFEEGKNCQNDGRQPLLNEQDLEDMTENIEHVMSYEFEPLDLDSPFVAQKKDLNALVFILGIAITKLAHEKCRSKLTAPQDAAYLDSEDYEFSK